MWGDATIVSERQHIPKPTRQPNGLAKIPRLSRGERQSSNSRRYSPYPSSTNFSFGIKRKAAELIQ